MKRRIIQTSDGSTTIQIEDWDECYHSKHGAIQEAKHVFIANGLDLFKNQAEISILEIGFGTGLNAFITFLETLNKEKVNYVGVEAYPILVDEVIQMNYVDELQAQKYASVFSTMHSCDWGINNAITDCFNFTKRKQLFQDIIDTNQYHLIYFDAFGYRVQPELWSASIFERMYKALKPKGVLVTYAARGIIKKNMMEVGFTVEKLAGPPGKREMFRANK